MTINIESHASTSQHVQDVRDEFDLKFQAVYDDIQLVKAASAATAGQCEDLRVEVSDGLARVHAEVVEDTVATLCTEVKVA